MISGNFSVCTLGAGTAIIEQSLRDKNLAMNADVKLVVGDRTLSIAMDNSCGAGRERALRNSISLEGPGTRRDNIIEHPAEETLRESLTWLLTGELSEELKKRVW